MAESFPRQFGKYIVVRPLSVGRTGELMLAVAGEVGGLEKLCVVKKLRTSGSDEAKIGRFIDEARVTVKLNHSNLVQVFDAGQVGDDHYLAMEYVEGRNLRALLLRCAETRARLPPEAGMHVAQQICRGLHYAHTYGDIGLVHRDLCPEHVLVSYFGEVKVADFGMAHSAIKEERTEPGKLYGRLSYLAPEQLRDGGKPDPRTDVFAVGVILWEMLVGEPMRPGATDPGEALRQIAAGHVVAPSSRNARLPPQLDPVVVKALQPRPEHRYPSARALREAIGNVLAQVKPTFDASELSEIMGRLYQRQIEAAKAERERLLATDYAPYRSRSTGPPSARPTPRGEVNLSGQTIGGRYRVTKVMGEGGMGAVYEAEHVEIGRRVAIKVLHAAFSQDQEAITRFREEARAATRIGHPNIIEVTDSGVTVDGRMFFVMEHLEGVDLASVMAKQRIVPMPRAMAITLQVCQALHAAHEAGIVHRDLKPENIFLSRRNGRDDFVTLLDFGIAKNVALAKEGEARLTMPGLAMGTPEYMAPEQAAGEDIDRRIDVYATASILYEMLTGHLPHEAQNLMQLLSKKASEPPTPPSAYVATVPPELEHTLMTGLHPDRERRFATVEELARALAPWDPNGGDAPPSPPPALTPISTPVMASPSASPQALPTPRPNAAPRPGAAIGTLPPATRAKRAPLERTSQLAANRTPPMRWAPWALALLVATLAVGGLTWWCSATEVAPPPPDAGAVATPLDAAPDIGPPDSTPPDSEAPDTTRPPLSPGEVARLLEWAKRAADGGRYLRPKGDNVRDLLERIVADHPGHPEVAKFRSRYIAKRLARVGARAAKRKRYASAERAYRNWLALIPDATTPRIRLASLELTQGYRALSRRRYKAAANHAIGAREVDPDGPGSEVLLGDIYYKRRRYKSAAAYYKNALSAKRLGKRAKRAIGRKLALARRKAR